MNAILAQPIDPHIDPNHAMHEALAIILRFREELGIPVKEIAKTSGGLERRGVTHLVTLEHENTEVDVPFRVENPATVRTLHCSKKSLASWHGKTIHSIFVKVKQTWGELVRMVIRHCRASLHRLKRKMQKRVFHNRSKLAKREARNARHCRPCREQLACH